MDEHKIWLTVIIVGASLAVANAWRATVLIRGGEKERGAKHMMFTAVILMLMTTALLLMKSGH